MTTTTDVMADVVERLVAAIEAGADDWQMPWRTITTLGWPTNPTNGASYHGGNVLTLHFAALDHGYPTSRWATYKQWATIRAHVRPGEHGTRCLYWKIVDQATNDDTDDGPTRPSRAWARTFVVFNAAQTDHDTATEPVRILTPLERDERADAFFAAIPAVIRWGAGNPCYRPGTDDILMPAFDAFTTTADAYATEAHELCHWTGHPSRLARTYGHRFGDDAYAAEELVAELGAAFTCALAGIDTAARTDHAAYLGHWARMLRAQPAILWTVAAKAQAAAEWLANYNRTPADLDPR
jgi:antirestriction protein ArdC